MWGKIEMEGGESDWDDLPEWVRDFLDRNELTELVWNYLKKRVPYETFKDWTFEELRAIKFRANVHNRAKVSQTSSVEPLPFLYSPDEEEGYHVETSAEKDRPAECESRSLDEVFPDSQSLPDKMNSESYRDWLESLIYSSIRCPDLAPRFCADWTIDELYSYAQRLFPSILPKPAKGT
jgi:hypothetical protein